MPTAHRWGGDSWNQNGSDGQNPSWSNSDTTGAAVNRGQKVHLFSHVSLQFLLFLFFRKRLCHMKISKS